MSHFADIDELPAEHQAAESINSFDGNHSGQSLRLTATPGTATRLHYQESSVHSIHMAKTQLHTARTTDYTRVHAATTVSQHSVLAPRQSEQFHCGQQLLSTYQTRTDHWQAAQQQEDIRSQHTIENHLQTYQLHVPGTLMESTPQHVVNASKLKHSIQQQQLDIGTLKHQAKLAQFKGQQCTVQGGQVGFGGDKLVLSD